MKLLTIFLLIIFPIGQLVRLNISGTEIVLHLNDLAVIPILIIGLRKITGPLTKPLLFFLIAIVISLLVNFRNFSLDQLATGALYPLRFYAYAGLYFTLVKHPEFKRVISRWLMLSVLIIAITGLLQYVFLPDVSFLKAFDWDDHYYRLVGSFLDPGFTGAILVLGLLVAFINRSWIIIPVYIALALTYSRASYLMYLVSFTVVAFYRKSVKIILIAGLILALTIPMLPKTTGEGTKLGRENSITARINNWKQTLTVWQQYPLFGVGFNTYRYIADIVPQSHSGGADSSIFLVLATTGIFGTAAYLYLLWVMWKIGDKNLLFKASFIGIIVHSFFNNTLFYPWAMEWLWITLALL